MSDLVGHPDRFSRVAAHFSCLNRVNFVDMLPRFKKSLAAEISTQKYAMKINESTIMLK